MTSEPSNSPAGTQTVQEIFLQHLRQAEAPVTVFLVNGVKLQGVVSQFDSHTLLLRRDGHVQLIYKHAISTIMPVGALPRFTENEL
ncbi:RNA chaperone Hfq [Gluconobacter frateurii]|uniref:RNA chaperone Hfq n=1 Tax=Gluconobacter frateurii TaxID=38308 RepID=UPI000C080FDE|nr:RNA chaperone Hfq [Gluconobacter frateurii]GLP89877.1 RNA-binding protein Hfq [Gluconobacter frateurii]